MILYNRENPFISKIKSRRLLSKEGSSKQTYHIVLDIKNSKIQYQPGDSVAILPQNDPKIADSIINHINARRDLEIIDPKTNRQIKIYDFLLNKANITKPTWRLLKYFLKNSADEEIKKYLSFHVTDILKEFSTAKIAPRKLCEGLSLLLPRLYSAASSLKIHPDEIHLVITHVSYEILGTKRNGVCTQFMCRAAKTSKTPVLIYMLPSSHFKLTKNKEKPIIMIAAGCGIAPFKAFLEERFLDNASGSNWLFFGERNEKTDFYFEDFLKDLVDKNQLRLTTSFSRDQEDKIYVQDKLLENQEDVWQWIQKGSLIYVCGDAKISKAVDETLKLIFVEEGNLNPREASAYLKTLIKDQIYLKDVF